MHDMADEDDVAVRTTTGGTVATLWQGAWTNGGVYPHDGDSLWQPASGGSLVGKRLSRDGNAMGLAATYDVFGRAWKDAGAVGAVEVP